MSTLVGPMMQRLIRQQWEREHPFRAWVERHADVLSELLLAVLVFGAYAVAVWVLGHIRL